MKQVFEFRRVAAIGAGAALALLLLGACGKKEEAAATAPQDQPAATATSAATAAPSLATIAPDSASCKAVRFADVGWSDIIATTAVTTEVFKALGYAPSVRQLAVPVTFKSLSTNDMDVFLGLWMPSMEADYKAYRDNGSVPTLAANLPEGAKYTLAVPSYVAQAGVKDFADLAKNADKFGKKIYSIEPGNDGNRLILDMVKKNDFNLKGWKVVESSEAGMIAQVLRAVEKKEWIVFLGWAPHPMNSKVSMAYLAGGDAYFGPNFGGATVHTVTRKTFASDCPNAAKLLSQIKFTVEAENTIMLDMMDNKAKPEEAAKKWLKANSAALDAWLQGVGTVDGKDAKAAVQAAGLGA